MSTKFWQSGIAAVVTAGLLAVSAIGQTGEASGEVKIEGNKPAAAAQKAPAATPAPQPIQPTITDRDPFVNMTNSGSVRSSSSPSRRIGSSAKAAGKSASVKPAKGQAANKADDKTEVEVIVPAPEVTITGIVKTGKGHQAIVQSSSGSYIVSPGQKLGDYRVASITDTAVTFTNTGKKFKILIDSPFGLGKK